MTIAEYLEQQGLERSLLQGRQEGRQEEAKRIAAAMLRSGLAPALVAQLTGLAEQELASLSA